MYKRIIVPLLLLFTLSSTIRAQQPKLNYNVQELSSLAKSWGFLKYYHPVVSQGKLNVDSLLLEVLNRPQKDPVALVIDKWLATAEKINALPNIPVKNERSDSVDYRNLNFNWIKKDPLFSATQKQLFEKWSKPSSAVGTFYSKSTKSYYRPVTEKNFPDETAAQRLLGLFRFWNAIEYFYPYKYAIGNPWDETLVKMIPPAIAAKTDVEKAKFMGKLSASIHDTHATVEPEITYKIFGKLGAPFKFKVIENTVVITKVADPEVFEKSGLAIGDLINTINGKSIKAILAEKSQYISSSNESVKERDAFFYLFNGDEPTVKITGVNKDGKPFSSTINRVKRNYFNEWDREGNPDNKLIYFDTKTNKLVYARVLDGNIGYIDRSSFVNTEIDSVMKMMKNTKGLIIDLRGYATGPGSLAPFNYLFPKPTAYGKQILVDFNKPGTFQYVDYILSTPTITFPKLGKENPDYYKGKLVLLINASTQSAEEMWAMIYRASPGAVVIGSQTAGADGNQTPIKVFGDYSIMMSGIGIFYPNGKETQRIGIVPDIVVKPTIKDMQEQKDVLFLKAIEVIGKQ